MPLAVLPMLDAVLFSPCLILIFGNYLLTNAKTMGGYCEIYVLLMKYEQYLQAMKVYYIV